MSPPRRRGTSAQDIRVSSWAELHEQLFADSWQEGLGLFRSHFGFRGSADAGADLSSALARLGRDAETRERHLVRNFRKYAARDAGAGGLAVEPARARPASNLRHFERDGAVWLVDYVQAHRRLPERLRDAVAEGEGAIVFTTELLGELVPKLGELRTLGGDFVLFVEPSSFDGRIVNQYASFSLTSRPDLPFHERLAERPELWRKLVIPADLKWEVRDKLDQANVTGRVLFPGLDGLSSWLARHYLPR